MSATCTACGVKARSLRPALVLSGPKVLQGEVCPGCAKLAWLLVLGADADLPELADAKVVGKTVAKRGTPKKRGEKHVPGPLPQSSRPQVMWGPGVAKQLEQMRGRAPAPTEPPPEPEDEVTELWPLDDEVPAARPSKRSPSPRTVQRAAAHEGFTMEEEALYQKIKKRLLDELSTEAPAVLRLLVTASELEVKVQPKVVELDASTLRGRLAQLIGEGFFNEPATASSAHTELKRLGVSAAKQSVYDNMDALAKLGIVTKEKDGFKRAPGSKIRFTKG